MYWVMFAGPLAAHTVAVRAIFVGLGVATALLGACMCFLQRHIKRLLAFSTISHVGMFVCGIALLTDKGVAGVAVYIVGHGLTKAALFMCAGVLLHRFATVDEYELHGRGRPLPAAGVLMAAGALLLAAIPPFTTFMGKSLLDEASSGVGGYGWLIAVYVVVSAVTGGAVLRVAGRVFLGWGPTRGPHPEIAQAAHEESEAETGQQAGRTPLPMLIVPGLLLVGVLVLGLVPGAVPAVERYAAQFVDHQAYSAWVLHGNTVALPIPKPSHVSGEDYLYSVVATVGAVLVAGAGLFGRSLRESLPAALSRPVHTAVEIMRGLHNGHIGDYIAWWSAGVSLIGAVCLLALR
jgi:multicomponent Na+:H+ antiporter subunit D